MVEEVLPGYLLDGQVVRPALVVVNRRPDRRPTAGDPEDEKR